MRRNRYVIRMPRSQIITGSTAVLVASAENSKWYRVPAFQKMQDPCPCINGDCYIDAEQFAESTFKVMEEINLFVDSDIIVPKKVAYCVYSIGVSRCTLQDLKYYFNNADSALLARELRKLEWQVAIDNETYVHELRDGERRKKEFKECIAAAELQKRGKSLKDDLLLNYLETLK